MRTFVTIAGLAGLLLSAGPAQAAAFAITFESEAPGLQDSTARFAVKGVETFEGRARGTGQNFTTDFGTGGLFTGRYSNVQINRADQYGGAGGTGLYAVTFSSSGYSLDLSSTRGPVNYFGYWLSALDRGNVVSFYRRGRLLFTFNPNDVRNAIGKTPRPSEYYGNPNSAFAGRNTGEPYVFVNFFGSRKGFDRVVFAETPQVGGYETDNHTVGLWRTMGTGTRVPVVTSLTPGDVTETPGPGVPEPATWAMLVAGFGLVGLGRRRRPAIAA